MRRLLDDCLDRIAGQPGAAAVWQVWNDAVGSHVARRAQPVRLHGRTLVVAVTSAPWMQELHMLKRSVVEEVNARLAAPLIDDLRLVLTENRPTPAAPLVHPPRSCAPAPSDDVLAHLPVPLRESFANVLAAWRRRASRG